MNTPPPIIRTNLQETLAQLQVLNAIAQHQPCTFKTLRSLVLEPSAKGKVVKALRMCLYQLIKTYRVDSWVQGNSRQFALGPKAYTGGAALTTDTTPPSTTTTATPDRYDRIHSATYTPPADTYTRAGGHHHRQYASFGFAC